MYVSSAPAEFSHSLPKYVDGTVSDTHTMGSDIDIDTVFSETHKMSGTTESDIHRGAGSGFSRMRLNNWLQVNGWVRRLTWETSSVGPVNCPTWTVVCFSKSLCNPPR